MFKQSGPGLENQKSMAARAVFLAVALVVATAAFPCLASELLSIRIDGGSAGGYEDSLSRLRSELSEPQEARLAMALLKLRLDAIGLTSDADSGAEGKATAMLQIRSQLNGLNYPQVIALAKLDDASSAAAMTELAGEWRLGAQGTAGAQTIQLSEDGRLIQTKAVRSVGRNYWYRSGDRVGLSFNDGFATLLGVILPDGAIEGVGDTVQGVRWRWRASRASVEADRPGTH